MDFLKSQTISIYKTESCCGSEETSTLSRKIAHIFTVFKAHAGERARKAVVDRLQRPYYLCRDDHDRNIMARKRRKDIGK